MSLEANSGEVELSAARRATAKAAIDTESISQAASLPSWAFMVIRPGPGTRNTIHLDHDRAVLAMLRAQHEGVSAELIVCKLVPITLDGGEQHD